MTATMSNSNDSTNDKGARLALPDICQHSLPDRMHYLQLLVALAATDHHFQAPEHDLLQKWMDVFQIPPQSQNAIWEAAEADDAAIQNLITKMAHSDLCFSLMMDMLGIALLDGILMDEERFFLREVAEGLEIDWSDFDILVDFIQAACQASQQANPDPIFEYSINAGFDLLKRHRIVLFPHTLLCPTNEDYNQQLKHRWMQQQAA